MNKELKLTKGTNKFKMNMQEVNSNQFDYLEKK